MSKVRLIAISKVVADDVPGDDAQSLIAYCARVSNPSNQGNPNSEKLLNYCMEHKHWSVFEMANATLEISTTRDIARQILRHRSFSAQEFSQRYADPTELRYEIREARLQDVKNRQNSLPVEDEDMQDSWETAQEMVWEQCLTVYQAALDKGIAKEVARAVLPEGMTPSRMYMNGSIRSWLHYCEVRTGPETQKEHREIARQCAEALSKEVPLFERFL